mgnify:FL=1
MRKNIQPVIFLLLLSRLVKVSSWIGNIRIQKLLFLVQEESPKLIENGFKFTPYKYGPYSDEVCDIALSLADRGLVELEQDGQQGFIKSYGVTSAGMEKATQLKSTYSEIENAVEIIADKYAKLNDELLLLYVYTKYPEFTFKSEIKIEVLEIAKKNFAVLQKKAIEIGFKESELDLVGV